MGGEDTWTETPFADGIVLIGDAGGYNGPIIGQGLSMALRDVRSLSELLLDEREWPRAIFEHYGEQRSEALRRMRVTAAFRALLSARFGREAAARRAQFRDRARKDLRLGNVSVATHLGPDRSPAWVFNEAIPAYVQCLESSDRCLAQEILVA